jgi:protein-disulfide isomerase
MSRRTYVGVAVAAGLLAAALIVASLVGARAGESAPDKNVPARAASALLRSVPQQGPALGRPDAPVTLVEFADIQCPYCAEWSNVAFEEIVRDYVRPGKVRIVFSGLAFIGPDSEQGLRFAHAAGRQGKLWQAVHLLYANQGPEKSGWVSDKLLKEIGASIPGLDVERALRESYSPVVDRQITKAGEAAAQLGVRGTPSFAAGRTGATLQPVSVSSLDADALRPALDSLLAE